VKTLADYEFDIVVNDTLLERMKMPPGGWVYFIRKFVCLPADFWEKNEDVMNRKALEAEGLDCYFLPCMDGARLPVRLMATPYPKGKVMLYVEGDDKTNPTVNRKGISIWRYPNILEGAPSLDTLEKSGLLKKVGGDGCSVNDGQHQTKVN